MDNNISEFKRPGETLEEKLKRTTQRMEQLALSIIGNEDNASLYYAHATDSRYMTQDDYEIWEHRKILNEYCYFRKMFTPEEIRDDGFFNFTEKQLYEAELYYQSKNDVNRMRFASAALPTEIDP